MNEYIFLNKHNIDTWMSNKERIILLRGNIIIKNLIVGQCFISNETHIKFKDWVRKNYE